uniref:Uncharacterized protein n=1 Tax=Parascaris univalens TaxID=6257 RepID=A0A915CF50_PARUN
MSSMQHIEINAMIMFYEYLYCRTYNYYFRSHRKGSCKTPQ